MAARRMLLAVIALTALLALPAGSASAASSDAGSAARMRCNGFVSLCAKRFDQISLAGTHNAMSNQAQGWTGPNQLYDIPTQLRRGIRAMLIDTYLGIRQANGQVRTVRADTAAARRKLGPLGFASAQSARRTALSAGAAPGATVQVYVCHVLCELGATPLQAVFRAVHRFLRAHPNDVMLFINEDHAPANRYAAVVRSSGLLDQVYRGSTSRWPTLATMARANQRVVMLAENDSGDYPWYHEAYDGILQETPYTFPTVADLTAPARIAASCRPNRGGRTGSLFLVNHWVGGVPPVQANARIVNAYTPLLRRTQTCKRIRSRQPTIVAIDFFGLGNLLGVVNRLNGVPNAEDRGGGGGGGFTGAAR